MTETETKTPKLTHTDLEQFTGDLERYRSIVNNVIYTPGVRFLADKAEAYWLIDLIASYYVTPPMRRATKADPRLESLQFWKLVVRPDRSAIVTASADSNVAPFISQEIPFTDFPLEHVNIWAAFDGQFWTLYLPSEH